VVAGFGAETSSEPQAGPRRKTWPCFFVHLGARHGKAFSLGRERYENQQNDNILIGNSIGFVLRTQPAIHNIKTRPPLCRRSGRWLSLLIPAKHPKLIDPDVRACLEQTYDDETQVTFVTSNRLPTSHQPGYCGSCAGPGQTDADHPFGLCETVTDIDVGAVQRKEFRGCQCDVYDASHCCHGPGPRLTRVSSIHPRRSGGMHIPQLLGPRLLGGRVLRIIPEPESLTQVLCP